MQKPLLLKNLYKVKLILHIMLNLAALIFLHSYIKKVKIAINNKSLQLTRNCAFHINVVSIF